MKVISKSRVVFILAKFLRPLTRKNCKESFPPPTTNNTDFSSNLLAATQRQQLSCGVKSTESIIRPCFHADILELQSSLAVTRKTISWFVRVKKVEPKIVLPCSLTPFASSQHSVDILDTCCVEEC
mmetsp:Transcript_44840/g.48536  ORF Transcript_44840/g.48536 Transcript_44840/m.48536 type:complete len:126 (+) Transcript_44840:1108-1485(+)